MAALNGASRKQRAIARLRAYVPPPCQFYNLPLSRRAAVLILLFADRHGDLRVVLTLRSATLSSYAGQAALPGGKADTLAEPAFQTARREAFEEIGLPLTGPLPAAFTVEHLCQLPTYLARTELGVRPCVAVLSPREGAMPASSLAAAAAAAASKWTAGGSAPAASSDLGASPSAEEVLIPQLDAKEVAAVFTAPFHSFLKVKNESAGSRVADEGSGEGALQRGVADKGWYQGVWTDWYGHRWRMHNFYVPTAGQLVARQKGRGRGRKEHVDEKSETFSPAAGEAINTPALPYRDHKRKDYMLDSQTHFRVFGMTARIIVDAARYAYESEPEFEHNPRFGDEDFIQQLMKMGKLGPIKKSGKSTLDRDLVAAAKI